MYKQEKKLIAEAGSVLKKQIPFLSGWKLSFAKKHTQTAVDITASAIYKNQTYRFCVEAKAAGYPQYIRAAAATLMKFVEDNPSYCPLIITPFISERGKKICDEYGIGYLDLNGNAKISCGSVFVHTRGTMRPKGTVTASQAIFSPKSARITRLLLGRPSARWIQRDIASNTELSKGLVSRVVAKMIETGYVMRKDKRLAIANFDDLFSAWVESEIKRRERKKHYYVWAQNPRKLMELTSAALSSRRIKYAFTQEAGASLVAPFATFDIVSVYVESFDKFPKKVLSASEIDRGFNLTLIEAPDQYVFTRAQNKSGMLVVDNLQLYADLMKNPLRGEKQAKHILKIIKKGLK
jgi:hypothetical protein